MRGLQDLVVIMRWMSAPIDAEFRIVHLDELDSSQQEQAAEALVEAFGHQPSGYHTVDIARSEVARFYADGTRAGFAAVSDGALLGWIGYIAHSEHAWELHPLVVQEPRQRLGIGTTLVSTLESHARA